MQLMQRWTDVSCSLLIPDLLTRINNEIRVELNDRTVIHEFSNSCILRVWMFSKEKNYKIHFHFISSFRVPLRYQLLGKKV